MDLHDLKQEKIRELSREISLKIEWQRPFLLRNDETLILRRTMQNLLKWNWEFMVKSYLNSQKQQRINNGGKVRHNSSMIQSSRVKHRCFNLENIGLKKIKWKLLISLVKKVHRTNSRKNFIWRNDLLKLLRNQMLNGNLRKNLTSTNDLKALLDGQLFN